MLKYRVKLSLLVMLLMPLLVSLGFWQLSRYEQKLGLEKMLQERLTLPSIPYSNHTNYPDPLYLPVTVRGHFDANRYFFRDNQVYAGQAGYELLMPFVANDGQWLLVNRGWVESASRDVLPVIETPEAEVELSGTLYRSLGKAFTLGKDHWPEGWPKRIQTLDFDQIEKTLNQKIPATLLVLKEHQPGALQVRSLAIKTISDKHLGYAFQWFTMAVVLLGLYLYQMINHRKTGDAGSHS